MMGEHVRNRPGHQVQPGCLDPRLVVDQQFTRELESSAASLVDPTGDNDGIVDRDRSTKTKPDVPGDREHAFDQDAGPDQNLVERRCGHPPMECVARSPIVRTRGEPGTDPAVVESEVIEMKPNGVFPTAGETAVVVMTSDRIDESGDVVWHDGARYRSQPITRTRRSPIATA